MQTLKDREGVSRQEAFITVGHLTDYACTVNIFGCFYDSLVKLTLEGGHFQ